MELLISVAAGLGTLLEDDSTGERVYRAEPDCLGEWAWAATTDGPARCHT
jgi:hypothetical protein